MNPLQPTCSFPSSRHNNAFRGLSRDESVKTQSLEVEIFNACVGSASIQQTYSKFKTVLHSPLLLLLLWASRSCLASSRGGDAKSFSRTLGRMSRSISWPSMLSPWIYQQSWTKICRWDSLGSTVNLPELPLVCACQLQSHYLGIS